MTHQRLYVESATIAERDSDGAFPTDFPVAWGSRPDPSSPVTPAEWQLAAFAAWLGVALIAVIIIVLSIPSVR